ncbi:AraC family transcriptional regulator [Acidocella sp.]|jgi:AraC family transcriptional activator of mtrCDE|uniref:AraC family transcriptional regulator n=1 Tax=Acidocella sp. TaxID=50710 RepID=UPI002F3E8908
MSTEEDALSALAPLLRVKPEIESICRFGGEWSSAHGTEPRSYAHFHIVMKGEIALERSGRPQLELKTGDVLLLPHGETHVVQSRGGGGRVNQKSVRTRRDGIRVQETSGVEPTVELICGRLHFTEAPQNLMIASLPDEIMLRPENAETAARFRSIIELIKAELAQPRLGALAIAEDIASALFVMMLRTHLESPEEPESAKVLRLLSDRVTVKAMLALIRAPSHPWSLDLLSRQVAVSRASLVRAFREVAGVGPMAFLSDFRLGLARRELRRGLRTLDDVAEEAGYQSQAAFSRAFLRRYGIRPGAFRSSR